MTLKNLVFVLAASCLSLSLCNRALAIEPEHKIGNWIGATSTLRYSDKWSLFLQGEVRTWEPLNNLNEVLWRIAGHYDFSKRHMGAFGYVRVDTWPYQATGLGKFDENRIFEEFKIKAKWNNNKIENRFRLEQRWITTPESGTQYSNRVRYKLGFTLPFNGEKIVPGSWYGKALNEVFIDFDRNGYWFNLQGAEKGLNQNRLYGGVGKQLKPHTKFEVGLLWQHRPSADFWRVLFSYSYNFDFRPEEN
jgi:hypothetical protein